MQLTKCQDTDDIIYVWVTSCIPIPTLCPHHLKNPPTPDQFLLISALKKLNDSIVNVQDIYHKEAMRNCLLKGKKEGKKNIILFKCL